MEDKMERAVMRVSEGCEYLGIGGTLFYRLIQEGAFPVVRVGGRAIRILKSDLDLYLERGREGVVRG